MAIIKLKFNTNAKETSSDMKGLGSSIGAIGGIAAAAFKVGTVALAGFTAASVVALKAFQGQAQSEIKLQSATENLGLSYEKNKERLLKFSNEMQDISTVGDEVTNDLTAFFITATGSIEMATKAARATIAESARTGKGLQTVREQIANAFGGQTSRIERQNAALRGLTKEQWKNGEALDVMFKGGEKFLKSMRELDPISNIMGRIGDSMEPIGQALLTVLNPAFEETETLLKGVTSEMNGSGQNTLVSGLKEATLGIVSFGVAALTVLEPVTSLVFKIADGMNKIATFAPAIGAKARETLGVAAYAIPGISGLAAISDLTDSTSSEILREGGKREDALAGGSEAVSNALTSLESVLNRLSITIENGGKNQSETARSNNKVTNKVLGAKP